MTKLSANETLSSSGPECPKCGFTFTPDDSIYFDENQYTEDECPECKTKFSVEVHHSITWCCVVSPSNSETPPMTDEIKTLEDFETACRHHDLTYSTSRTI